MSSSSSNSSDSEESTPVKDQKSASSSESSSSDSDTDTVKKPETTKNKPKHLLHQSTPLQSNALSSKLTFQKMLMGSNNKLALLKNKQNVAEKNKIASPSPVKGILKKSKTKSNNTEIEFDPIASSTQIKEISMSETLTEKSKKIKQKQKEYVSETESSSDENVSKKHSLKKKKKKHHNASETTSKNQKSTKNNISHTSSESEDETQIERREAIQDARKLKKVQKDSSSNSSDESSSNKHNYSSNKKSKTKSSSESESEDEKNVSVPSKLASQFEKFESYYQGITRINEELLENITSEDEIFMVQIPKKLDPKSLIGTKISLTETIRVPEGSRKYDCIPSQKPQKDIVTIFTNTKKVQLIRPIRNIKIQKHIKSKNIPDLSDMWTIPVTSFPENLKQRHPLFGADYSDKLNLEEHIQAKLNAAVESYEKQKRKKKKHKKKEIDVSQEEPQEEIFKFLNQTDSSAKQVKIKEETDSGKSFENSKPKIKSAKIKKEIESEKSSEELETKHKKKKKKEKAESIESEEQIEQLATKKKKGKKRKKHSHDDESDELFSSEEPRTSKKQRFYVMEHISSKKIKKENSEDATQLINEMLLSKSMEISPSKVKKKSKHSQDDLEASKSSDLETKKKKHKKEHKSL